MLSRIRELFRVPPDLDEAELQGTTLTLLLRTLVLVPMVVLQFIGASSTGNYRGPAVVFGFLALGAVHWLLIRWGWERRWHRIAFLVIDLAGMGAAAVLIPLVAGSDVPQIMVFRNYGAELLGLFIALSALSLSPSVVLAVGLASVVMLWTVFVIVAAGVANPLSWADLPPNATGDEYMALVLNPNFIGRGNRIWETIALLGTTFLLAAAVARARGLIEARIESERRREQLQGIFGQYVPEGAAEAILSDGGLLRPRARQASALFIDIAGFTRLSETVEPEALVPVLNAYFDTVARTVSEHGGVVVSFHGDAVLAAFNVPIERPGFAADAIACAKVLMARVDASTFVGRSLSVRIGLASGPVVAGSVGGRGRQTYSIYGDTVNLAQRLEAKNKALGTRILICETTQNLAGQVDNLSFAGTLDIEGLNRQVGAYSA